MKHLKNVHEHLNIISIVSKKIFLSAVLVAVSLTTFSQVGIGTTSPNASAALDIESTTQGLLLPRMTEVEMNAISAVEGLIVYCLDCSPKGIYANDGSIYVSVITGAASAETPEELALVEILEDSDSVGGANNANGILVSFDELSDTGVTGLDLVNLTAYQVAIVAETGFSNPPTISELQEIIDAVNTFGTDTTTTVMNVMGTDGREWMDRNLGASQVATSSIDEASYGDLYQWGRLKDGHESRTSSTTPITVISADPGHGDFIIVGAGLGTDNNWTNFLEEDGLWQSGLNDPCPAGYRVPTNAELVDGEFAHFSSDDATGAFNSVLKLPSAGFRSYSSGSLNEVGT